MAKALTPIQKAVNDDFKRLDENFQLPTPSDYEEFDDFKKLVELKQPSSTLEDIFDYDIRLREMIDTSPHINEILHQEMTAHIYGIPLSNRSLLRRLADSRYAEATLLQDEALDKPNNTINLKIHSWISYCQLVNQLIEHINETKPRWGRMDKVEKKEYIKQLETFKTAPFIQTSLLEISIDFLKKYKLNQKILAKANFLLELELPNVTSLAVAKEIIQKTTFTV